MRKKNNKMALFSGTVQIPLTALPLNFPSDETLGPDAYVGWRVWSHDRPQLGGAQKPEIDSQIRLLQ